MHQAARSRARLLRNASLRTMEAKARVGAARTAAADHSIPGVRNGVGLSRRTSDADIYSRLAKAKNIRVD